MYADTVFMKNFKIRKIEPKNSIFLITQFIIIMKGIYIYLLKILLDFFSQIKYKGINKIADIIIVRPNTIKML